MYDTDTDASPEERAQRIQSLREMINNAERTIQGAKAMLLQIEGKKKAGRKRKVEDTDGTVVEGSFDGQIMVGTDGRQYPVPANYASKSKLVEGDVLKLTITPDGAFIYKQIGPIPRKNAIGVVSQDERGNYYVVADGRPYKVLLASITYFRAEPGDEVVVMMPREGTPTWAVIENVIARAQAAASAAAPRRSRTAPASDDTATDTGEAWSSEIRDIDDELSATA